MTRSPKTKLDLKNEDATKWRRSRRAAETWKKTEEGQRALAITEEFRLKWQRELAEHEAVLQAIRESF